MYPIRTSFSHTLKLPLARQFHNTTELQTANLLPRSNLDKAGGSILDSKGFTILCTLKPRFGRPLQYANGSGIA